MNQLEKKALLAVPLCGGGTCWSLRRANQNRLWATKLTAAGWSTKKLGAGGIFRSLPCRKDDRTTSQEG